MPLPAAIPAREALKIDKTTATRIYSLGVAQAAQGDLVFVFTPLATNYYSQPVTGSGARSFSS